jgi:cytochrome P450
MASSLCFDGPARAIRCGPYVLLFRWDGYIPAGTMTATRSIDDLPGPPRLPVLGNVHQMVRPARAWQVHLTAERWSERYGPIFRFDVGSRRMVTISDADAINTILRDRPDGFRRWSEQEAIFHEMGIDGVFSAEGADWRRQRALVVRALNSNHLQRYFHVVRIATERLYRQLAGATSDGREVEVAEELSSYTVDVTSALAFGYDLNTLEHRDSELQEHIQRVFSMIMWRVSAPFPYWRWVRLPADRRLDRSVAVLHRAVAGFIEQARERMRQRPELAESPENFLEGMLAAQQAEGTFTDEEIIGNTLTLLTAGEDTTSHTLGWTLWYLSTRPEMQDRLAQEACEILGEQRFPVEHEMLSSMHYGEAVLKESMRLKPAAVANLAEPLKDTTLCGTHIPADTRLWMLTRHAGLLASEVERANEFDPQRWLGGDGGEQDAPDQKSFLAFGAGPRFCPGRNLAFLEAKSALAMIVRNFHIDSDPSSGPVTEQLRLALVPQGLKVRLRERAAGKPIPGVSLPTVTVALHAGSPM